MLQAEIGPYSASIQKAPPSNAARVSPESAAKSTGHALEMHRAGRSWTAPVQERRTPGPPLRRLTRLPLYCWVRRTLPRQTRRPRVPALVAASAYPTTSWPSSRCLWQPRSARAWRAECHGVRGCRVPPCKDGICRTISRLCRTRRRSRRTYAGTACASDVGDAHSRVGLVPAVDEDQVGLGRLDLMRVARSPGIDAAHAWDAVDDGQYEVRVRAPVRRGP